METVPKTASLWAGDRNTGHLDVYSCVSGQRVLRIPPRSHELVWGGGKENSGNSAGLFSPPFPSPPHAERKLLMGMGGVEKPSALKATLTHVWVGYDSGNVAVYDHLVFRLITEGRFHCAAVVSFAFFTNHTTVSASGDGMLVHWNQEEHSFEAITHIRAIGKEEMKPSNNNLSTENRLTSLATLQLTRQYDTPNRGLDGIKGKHGSDRKKALTNLIILCGFDSGIITATSVLDGNRFSSLNGHKKRINSIVVLGELLFSASEDCTVCVWSLHLSESMLEKKLCLVNRLVKRIPVSPSARSLLADPLTSSIWVAYADGLLERWSGNLNDNFGIEEVVRDGMLNSIPNAQQNQSELKDGAGQVGDNKGGDGSEQQQVIGMLAIGSVETLQVLALSSNGMNKTWYGQRNILEESLSDSIQALNSVICEDAHDAAVWRERLNSLKKKEFERKRKYAAILENTNCQKTRLRFFERWRRLLLQHTSKRDRQATVSDLSALSTYRLLRRNFTKWGNWHDQLVRRRRRAHIAILLKDSNERTHALSYFQHWRMLSAKKKLRRFSLQYLDLIVQASETRLLSVYFCKLRCFVQLRAARKGGLSTTADPRHGNLASPHSPQLLAAQIQLLSVKAQRQVLHRALRKWVSLSEEQKESVFRGAALNRYAALYCQTQQQRLCRSLFHTWRRWCTRKKRMPSVRVMVTLLEKRCRANLQEQYYLQWCARLHASRLRQNTEEAKDIEARLLHLEEDFGGDIFEKLRLQNRINVLIDKQSNTEVNLKRDQERLRALTATNQDLRQRAAEFEGAHPLNLTHSEEFSHLNVHFQSFLPPSTAGMGPISANAGFYRRLIDQQRLAPGVLAQMPLPDAVHHAIAQLKGNVLNLYTDLAIFRQVKDRRRGGISAAAIFLEAFAEIKRLVVSMVKTSARPSLRPPPAVGNGGDLAAPSSAAKGARWAISLENLDRLPSHHCAAVLSSIKTMVVAYDLLSTSDAERIMTTCEEMVQNTDWIFVIARACYLQRKPILPENNRA
ncbi:unnamed protein product [Phytomonas sp. Hart1]|nr:unnamed protein product [Phytomonas sp. Hart1]|eukprot:CCW71182.1 unnamed protein product [Phytomonas sp. isolate Hart1]